MGEVETNKNNCMTAALAGDEADTEEPCTIKPAANDEVIPNMEE